MRPLLDTFGGKQKLLCISETLLYELVFQSRKKNAVTFRAWVTSEVLPALRKHGEYRISGKLIRRSLTDTIKDSGENERMHGHGYSTYSIMINKSLGLPAKNDRNTLPEAILEALATRENTVKALINEGRTYNEIKAIIETFKPIEDKALVE